MEDKIRLAKMEQTIEDMKETLCEHHKTLFGNGKPGLKYDIVKMKNAIYFNNIITTLMTTALIWNLITWLVI